jgi:DNA-binding transcriptional MerR regulator
VAAEVSGRTLRSGELAKLAGVSTDLLRHYERIGVLAKAVRGSNGYRRYPAAALTRVRVVRRAVSLGFTLTELARVFGMRDRGGVPCEQVRRLAEEKLKRLDEALIETRNLRRQLGRIVRDWDRRLKGRANGQRAHLLQSLEKLPFVTKTRANSRGKGWPRK